ncbi:MAG: SMC-Scp complex subunit ScpB [Parvibaculales bacterium]
MTDDQIEAEAANLENDQTATLTMDDLSETLAAEYMRIIEAVLFAAVEPLDTKTIGERLPEGVPVLELIECLKNDYDSRGVHLKRVGGKYSFRTAEDLSHVLQTDMTSQRKLSRAALETLAIISYHQPVTRAEIEDIRGVSVSKGTLDVLLETQWVKIRGRRRVPGRPVTYGTTDHFLEHFGLEHLSDLPGIEELKAAGLLDNRLPQGFSIPEPDPDNDHAEDPLAPGDDGSEPPLEMDLPEDDGRL